MAAAKSFQLLIPFLEEWIEMNPGSVVNWEVDKDEWMKHVFVCLPYTGHIEAHCHPIVSADAAHLMSCYNSTIFIYSGVTGADESYIYAFRISSGNEDYPV